MRKGGDALALSSSTKLGSFLPAINTTDKNNTKNDPKYLSNIKTAANALSFTAKRSALEECSTYSSPSLISPPSSAFVSALQSPYISPRALTPDSPETDSKNDSENQNASLCHTVSIPPTPAQLPFPPPSLCGSHSEDIPSSSYTPVEKSDFSDDGKPKYITCISDPMAPPRVSFSFPVPRVSFAKSSVSPAVNAKLRSCDVYIGYHGANSNLVRYCKWVKSELELQGVACFIADRARYADTQSHEIADRVICSASFGIVVISSASLFNHFSMEEIRFFSQKKNLIPMFFDMESKEITGLLNNSSVDKECREALQGLIRAHEFKLECLDGDWRSCISKAASVLQAKLGRKSVSVREQDHLAVVEEIPFPRNKYFVGRQKEMVEIETAFFGYSNQESCSYPSTTVSRGHTSGQSEGFADEETDMDDSSVADGRYISLEFKGTLASEGQFEPTIGRNSLKRPKYKKSRSGKDKGVTSSVVCISGPPGVGKTELALEFAYKYSHRYKMVLWVGGEARCLRQNVLNISVNMGLDVSADPEKERGRIRNFEEQEYEAFKRIKRELFRDMPYLIIIDHLESENEWWEGKDLHDLIPRNTGGSHVIITTRLPKIMNFDPMPLQAMPLPDAMVMLRGRRKKEYPSEEYECLKKFEEKLGGSVFGSSVVGSLLSELAISPSALFEIVQQTPIEDLSDTTFLNASDEEIYKNNPFLVKLLDFCFAILEKATKTNNCLASRMLLVGAWFAPSPISANLLATAARNMPSTGSRITKWTKCLNPASYCCSGCPLGSQAWKSEEEYALLLVRLGLARKATGHSGIWIQFHPITRTFSRTREPTAAIQATVIGIRKVGNSAINSDHLWATAFLVFGFKSEPPLAHLKVTDMVLFIKKTALPLAIGAFTTFSRCNSSLELLKVCTSVLEDVEKSFVSQIQDWCHGSLCWKKKLSHSSQKVDEYVWEEVTLLKATLMETRAKLLLRGGYFDSAEELCRTCISIRTVMLGHNHTHTLAAQETLAKLVRLRSKI
ncbi:uncharacterized protein LOC141592098 isoform X1 [Silene latifolia]|uniref:uncharacterized protein LOC141592098 isoform X1 n=1 Tax=Silene latifolia TaxID=37657 RepID=UPI003D771B31